MTTQIKISNWFLYPDTFKKLVSCSNKANQYKVVPDNFELKLFGNTFVKKITNQLLKDIYNDKSFANNFYSQEEITILETDINRYETLSEYFEFIWNNKISKIFNEHCESNKELIEKLKKEKEDSEDKFFNSKNFKIRKVKSQEDDETIVTIYCNDIEIGVWKKYQEFFCTIKNGVKSNLRDKQKTATDLSWNANNLKTICNNPYISVLKSSFNISTTENEDTTINRGTFKDDYPDTSWGYTGPSLPSNTNILESIKNSYIIPEL